MLQSLGCKCLWVLLCPALSSTVFSSVSVVFLALCKKAQFFFLLLLLEMQTTIITTTSSKNLAYSAKMYPGILTCCPMSKCMEILVSAQVKHEAGRILHIWWSCRKIELHKSAPEPSRLTGPGGKTQNFA